MDYLLFWFFSHKWLCILDNTGVVPVSGPDDVILDDMGNPAGHAVCAVGYDDDKQIVIIRNSWGQNGEIKAIVIFHMNYSKMELCKICGQDVNFE